MGQYKHIISLGYFCSVALELERFGLRDCSYPFDWVTIGAKNAFMLINNGFKDFLMYDNLFQNKTDRHIYKDIAYDICFYHDFNKYDFLSKQLSVVKEKYNRRINKFYQKIKEPTLFVRYISDEEKDIKGKAKELCWLENNIDYILTTIKKFNKNNNIIFIGNIGLKSDKFKIYNVNPDVNDRVARRPFETPVLKKMFTSLNIETRKCNLAFLEEKKRKEKKSVYYF